jgi:hypothetical protein
MHQPKHTNFVEANLWKLTSPARRLPKSALEQLTCITEAGPFSLAHLAACDFLQSEGHALDPNTVTFSWSPLNPTRIECTGGAPEVPTDFLLTPSLLQALTTEVDSWLYRNAESGRIVVAPANALASDSAYAAELRASLMGSGPETRRKR